MRRQSVSVEFLGLPGAGKSTLSSRVGQRLASRGLQVAQNSYRLAHGPTRGGRVVRKLFRLGREVLYHPLTSIDAARSIAASGQGSLFLFIKMLFNWLVVSDLARQGSRRAGLHLHDQGIFQGLWSLGLDGDEKAMRRIGPRLVGALPPPDLLVIIDASREEVERRLQARQGNDSRLDRDREPGDGVLDRCALILDVTKSVLEVTTDGKALPEVLVVRNESPEDLEREVANLSIALEQMSHDADLPAARTHDDLPGVKDVR